MDNEWVNESGSLSLAGTGFCIRKNSDSNNPYPYTKVDADGRETTYATLGSAKLDAENEAKDFAEFNVEG